MPRTTGTRRRTGVALRRALAAGGVPDMPGRMVLVAARGQDHPANSEAAPYLYPATVAEHTRAPAAANGVTTTCVFWYRSKTMRQHIVR